MMYGSGWLGGSIILLLVLAIFGVTALGRYILGGGTYSD